MFKRILVPLDGSRFSSSAVKYAVEVSKHFEADIIFMQVVVPATPYVAPTTPTGTLSPTAAKFAAQAARLKDRGNISKAKRYLQRKVREITNKGLKCSYKVTMGNPAESIMSLCSKKGVDLVVMSSHGKGGLKRAIMGSVADKLARESRVPILLIRPRRK